MLDFIAYHEAGHAVAALNSFSYEVLSITIDEKYGRVQSVPREKIDSKLAIFCSLEKAMITCAGMAAGCLYRNDKSLPAGFEGDMEGYESDLETVFATMKAMGYEKHHAEELMEATFGFFRQDGVWNQVNILADHLLRKSQNLTGLQARDLIESTHPYNGKGLPVPASLLSYKLSLEAESAGIVNSVPMQQEPLPSGCLSFLKFW